MWRFSGAATEAGSGHAGRTGVVSRSARDDPDSQISQRYGNEQGSNPLFLFLLFLLPPVETVARLFFYGTVYLFLAERNYAMFVVSGIIHGNGVCRL